MTVTAEANTSVQANARDGFYARLGLGVGGGWVTSRISVPYNDWNVDYEGAGWAFDLMAGGQLDGWLVLGGGIFATELPAPSVESEPGRVILPEALAAGRLGMATLGPVVDVFLDSERNAYLGVIGGLGGIGLEDKDGDWSRGWSMGLHGGYDVRVSAAWTLGVSLRCLYIRGSRKVSARPATTEPGRVEATAQDAATSLALLFSVAYR